MNVSDLRIGSFTRRSKNDTFPIMNITCAILAGGYSTRMGQDKATLEIHGKTLIRYVFEKVEKVFRDIVIISSNDSHSAFKDINAPIIKDVMPVHGPVVGIASALLYSKNTYVFACACDMPFIHENTIRYMVDAINGEDIIIPKTGKGYEPLHALYNRSCISHILTSIERNHLNIRGIFPALTVKALNDHPSFYNNGHSVFMNINTTEDLEILREM